MPRETKIKRTGTRKYLAANIESSNERHPDSAKEAGKRAWATETKKTTVGKKSGSGRRPHSPRDTLPR